MMSLKKLQILMMKLETTYGHPMTKNTSLLQTIISYQKILKLTVNLLAKRNIPCWMA